jgi:hypothetical protein
MITQRCLNMQAVGPTDFGAIPIRDILQSLKKPVYYRRSCESFEKELRKIGIKDMDCRSSVTGKLYMLSMFYCVTDDQS